VLTGVLRRIVVLGQGHTGLPAVGRLFHCDDVIVLGQIWRSAERTEMAVLEHTFRVELTGIPGIRSASTPSVLATVSSILK